MKTEEWIEPCFLTDHEVLWDGNQYTCLKCFTKFVPKALVNEARQDEIHRFLSRSDSLGESKYATRRLRRLTDYD